MPSRLRFHLDRLNVVWLPLLLGCFFSLCDSQSSSSGGGSVFGGQQTGYKGSSDNDSGKSVLSQPGVVVGIIVGVAGVLVVVGVVILLCRLFCCKHSCCCCSCCKREDEAYLNAGTVPIKIPGQDDPPVDNPTRTRPPKNHTRKTPDGSPPPSPPQYGDIPASEFNLDEMIKKKKALAPEDERGSQESLDAIRRSENLLSLSADDKETASNVSSSGTKQIKTPTRRKLTYDGADNPDLAQDGSGGQYIALQHPRPKKRNVHVASHSGREFSGHKHQKDNLKPPHDDALDRNADEVSGGREFPLLEHEPGKRSFSYNPSYGDGSRKTWRGGAGDQGGEFRPVEFDYQTQYSPTSYPDHHQYLPASYPDNQHFPTSHPEHQQHLPTSYPDHQQYLPTSYPDHQQNLPTSHPDHQQHLPTPHPDHQQNLPTSHPNHQQHLLTSYPKPSSRKLGGERRPKPREPKEALATRDTPEVPMNNANYPSHTVQYISGRVNHAFNQDSTETSV
ncbi:hypothetical protein ACOMHN_020676 [Nucella lapillus]